MSNKTAHQVLTNLEETGELKTLIKSGFCDPCIIRDLNIFRSVNAQMQTGSGKHEAVCCTAISFKLSESRVYRIVKHFK